MDYAIRILKELIKEIQNTPYEELKKTINEADTKYREILQKRGEQVSAPVIRNGLIMRKMKPILGVRTILNPNRRRSESCQNVNVQSAKETSHLYQ